MPKKSKRTKLSPEQADRLVKIQQSRRLNRITLIDPIGV